MNQLPVRNTIVKRAGDIEFWRSICPQLSISERPLSSHMQPYAVPPCDVKRAGQQVLEEGYFQVGPVVPTQETKLIADAVRTVVDHGFPAPFVLVYDQVWQMLSRLENLLSPILGTFYHMTLDAWIYYIRGVNEDRAESKEDSGWSPHRDGKTVINTLRGDGRPQLLNVWIPFTDTTVEHSCMYVLPTHLDPNYPDNLQECSVPRKSLQDIRALPAEAGAVLGWNEYALHWGSRSSRWAGGPRISLTARFQSRDLEGSNLPTLDSNSSFNFQARLATIGTVFNTYGRRKKCPEDLVNFCCSQVLLYNAINLRIFKERSAVEGTRANTDTTRT
jgi:Phytanoyl-CoA dioxygenase (PhyH)